MNTSKCALISHFHITHESKWKEYRLNSVPLRTGTCYIRHFCVVFARLLCSTGITN